MYRQEKLNSLIKEKLSYIVNSQLEIPDVLVTLINVNVSPDLKQVKTTISILPENRVITVLKTLKKKSGFISEQLQKEANLARVPKLTWTLDVGEQKAKELEKILNEN